MSLTFTLRLLELKSDALINLLIIYSSLNITSFTQVGTFILPMESENKSNK